MFRSTAPVATSILIPTLGLGQADLTERYRETAGRILGAALTDVEGWEKLEYLTTDIGHRLSGSESRRLSTRCRQRS